MDRRALSRDLFEATATGALTLVDPHRLSPPRRAAYRVAVAALAGLVTDRSAREVMRDEDGLHLDSFEVNNIAPALGVGAAGLVFGTMPLWERFDLATHRWLERRGVKHPRRVLAGLAVVGTLATAVADRTSKRPARVEEEFEPRREPLDTRLRDVLRAILGVTDEYGAASLRRQLADAVGVLWDDPEDAGTSLPEFLELRLNQPDAHELVVPRTFTFPVRARTRGGHEIRLGIADGRLDHVVLDWLDGHPVGDEDWPSRWPSLEEVTLVHDHEVTA